MTLAGAAAVAIVALLVAAVVFGILTVVLRLARGVAGRRRAALAAPARRLLVRLTAGDDDETLIDQLAAVGPRTWRAVEPAAVAMLGKVRGEAHTALVTVFQRRGAGERARRDLTARSPVRRARAAEVLGNLGDADAVRDLCLLLPDRDRDVRVVVVRALGRIADASVAGALLDATVGVNRVPPQLVAHALVRLGVAAHHDVAQALSHPSELARATALEVLGLIGAVGVAKQVEFALRSDLSLEVRVRAARTLGRLGTRSALAPLLEAVEPDRPAALRAEAARALGELGSPAAAQPLAALLADPEYRVAHHAARALLRLGRAGRTELQNADSEHAREALGVAALEEGRRELLAGAGASVAVGAGRASAAQAGAR
jgi:HEAT repeat protein